MEDSAECLQTGTFPPGTVVNMYQYWIHGDETKGISLLKRVIIRADLFWCKDHPREKRYQRNISGCHKLFGMIDEEVKRLGLWKEYPSRANTVDNFYKAKGVWGLDARTKKGQKRNFEKMIWATTLRLLQRQAKEKKDSA